MEKSFFSTDFHLFVLEKKMNSSSPTHRTNNNKAISIELQITTHQYSKRSFLKGVGQDYIHQMYHRGISRGTPKFEAN